MNARTLRRLINLWPPFLCSGIQVRLISDDYREVEVVLKQHWYNSNYVGVHFGGSLFAMTDGLHMIMLIKILGHDYYVWDQCSSIEYIKPGRGTVKAWLRLDDATLATIREKTAGGEKFLPEFEVEITNAGGEVVARVQKKLYVRLKPPKKDWPTPS
jgi:acyl-coenzyme A thioesterase PaaI-like protein